MEMTTFAVRITVLCTYVPSLCSVFDCVTHQAGHQISVMTLLRHCCDFKGMNVRHFQVVRACALRYTPTPYARNQHQSFHATPI